MKKSNTNLTPIQTELNWLREHILHIALGTDAPKAPKHKASPLARLIKDRKLTHNDRLVLMLAMAPRISPAFLNNVLNEVHASATEDRPLPELFLVRHASASLLLPTVNTAYQLLFGTDEEKQADKLTIFSQQHFFFQMDLIHLEHPGTAKVPGTELLLATDVAVRHLIEGRALQPEFSQRFPAKPMTTSYNWDELVLASDVVRQVSEIRVWLENYQALMAAWGDRPKIKRGYRALFYGPPGTGKTLTAALLGKYTNREVFRIDLSMVVSKYIGETEKNLARVFDMAEGKNWILFFDEADALFGKRTSVSDAHDRYANQEVSFLLQRIEDYDGLVILASNKKDNLDEAFVRRFQSIIEFPMPKPVERAQLWTTSMPTKIDLGSDVSISELAKKYEMAGGSIINALHYATLMTIRDKRKEIPLEHIRNGIVKEFRKEGRNV